eukprot:TRINITY_DN1430_c0_g4_i1.p1 TRINITY_DN1430_c0_g4~~TRINITY_DN1430_c0_g4_i1.p1  ORF type:complete len:263 (-),score=43.21 TRINITY_DN1430_c0_g4_i1:210-998(-)
MFQDDSKRKKSKKSKMKLEDRKFLTFVPYRCGYKGCDSKETIFQACGGCDCIYYCSKEHQASDWPRHKIECNHVASLSVHGKAFSTEKELEKYPLGCFPLYSSMEEAESKGKKACIICGSKRNLTLTECCGMPVCDNEDEYVMFSYSREFCIRNHSRYTLCGFHATEGHDGDWRECSKCFDDLRGEAISWYGTNGWNCTPMLEKDIKKDDMLSEKCVHCGGRIMTGFEGHSSSRDGISCETCSNIRYNARVNARRQQQQAHV